MSSLRWLVVWGACAILSCSELKAAPADGGDEDAASVNDDAGHSVSHFCATATPPPQFCSDFDEGELVAGFENALLNPDPSLTGGGQLRADTNAELSKDGTRSVALSVPPLVMATSSAAAFLSKVIPIVPTDLVFVADVRIMTEQLTRGGGRIALLNVEWGRPGKTSPGAFVLLREAVGMSLTVFDGLTPLPSVSLGQSLPVGQWKDFRFILYNRPMDGGSSGRLDVYIDKVLAARSPVPATFQTSTTTPIVNFGIAVATGPMGEVKMNVDNVQMRWD